MSRLIRRPLAALLRRPHKPRRTRPEGYIGARRIGARRCNRNCRCHIRYARGIAPAAPVLAETLLMPVTQPAPYPDPVPHPTGPGGPR